MIFKTVEIYGGIIDLQDRSLMKGRAPIIGGVELAYSHVYRGSDDIGKLVRRGFSVDKDLVDKTCVLLYHKKEEWDNKLLLETGRLKRREGEGLLKNVIAVRKLSNELAARTEKFLETKIADYIFMSESDAIIMGLESGHQVLVDSEPVFKNARSIDLGELAVLRMQINEQAPKKDDPPM